MKEYSVLIANPAGNITAIVLDRDIERKDYIHLSDKLMGMKEFGIEQVGFVKNPKMGGELRLEMMGGEFCGNATRSFGLYIAASRGETGYKRIGVEISGCSDILEVETNVAENFAGTSMPLPMGISYIDVDAEHSFPVVEFEGIVHVIAVNENASDDMYERIKQIITKKYDPEAFGVMFFKKDECSIIPVVFVKETNSVIYEQSCGSGTIAAAIYLAGEKNDGIFTYSVSNPGGIIEAQICKKDGKIVSASIGGKVILSEIKSIKL